MRPVKYKVLEEPRVFCTVGELMCDKHGKLLVADEYLYAP
jgi:hypothetical protein